MNEDETEHVDALQMKHTSLLRKYEIPIDHLSYEYINKCNSVKELERIVKILRSGEEGHFPDLQKTAEERLRNFSPNNRLLRTNVPALDKSCFDKKEWGQILGDIETWKKEVSVKDKKLCNADDGDATQVNLPPVRQPLIAKPSSASSDSEPKSKKKVSDYAFWDKYDVETELIKMDLEEERKKCNKEKKMSTKEAETDRLKCVLEEAKTCSDTEKQILAEQEKIRGNEFYQAKDYVEAEKYYTASIAIYPTANAFNNRASCYLKQDRFRETIQDADNALKIEPNNVKALYRKGIALKNVNENQKAMENINAILRQEPNNSLAQSMVKQIAEKVKIGEVKCDSDLKTPNQNKTSTPIENDSSSTRRECFEVNEWGLPKTSCRCFGVFRCNVPENKPTTPTSFMPVRSFSPTLNKIPENVRIIELANENEQLKQKPTTKLEIIEIDTPHQEPLEDFCRPNKCNVVDRRTKKTMAHGGGDVI